MRINKYLAMCGLGSRRSVEALVRSGKISVNGNVITDLSTRVLDSDIVCFNKRTLKIDNLKKYFLINKPVGYVCTNSDEHALKKITELDDRLDGLFIVGRLDKQSEGLVLMTNDGEFCQKYQHPRCAHEKEYMVEGRVIDKNHQESEQVEKLFRFFKCGCLIDGYKTRPSEIKLLAKRGATLVFKIILKEGRKRQIRRLFSKAGLEVEKLKRIRIGNFLLGDLSCGQVIELDQEALNDSVDK